MLNYQMAILIPLLPLFFFLFLGLAGSRFKPVVSGILGTFGLSLSTLISYIIAIQYFFINGKVEGVYSKITVLNITWINFTDTLHVDLGILLDPISVMMLVVITTVSLMVHIYSLGYMKGEKGFERFYAFLSLFSFSMLGLVLATNLFQTYICWELVGISSYLLIGFYYEKPSAVAASKKAFIVTRFADLGFLIGILILSFTTGTFNFNELLSPGASALEQTATASFLGLSSITWAMLLIFMGCAGKSAMFPLHIWLPDAMEGPTPVSALIHAATMVVAGVFLVARLFPIYVMSAPAVLELIGYVGAFTSLFAAVIAITQIDIKRVLAFSTLSQIGYMMLALGVSGYGGEKALGYMASMFHLFTHAMFKSLLFLGAGALIHAVHSNNMTDMGGLRKYMPITHFTFLIACLTIAGMPPFSGFFSKDEILAAAFENNKFLFIIEFLVAGLTAFYMFRLYFNVFWGKNTHYHHTPHEAPLSMTIPLLFLALASAICGFIPFHDLVTADNVPFAVKAEIPLMITSVGIGLAGIILAMLLYKKENQIPEKMAEALRHTYKLVYNKFYIDEVYLFITKKIIFHNISRPVAWFDRHIVDGAMNGIAAITMIISRRIKGLQSGQLQHYAFAFIMGAIALAVTFIYIWLHY